MTARLVAKVQSVRRLICTPSPSGLYLHSGGTRPEGAFSVSKARGNEAAGAVAVGDRYLKLPKRPAAWSLPLASPPLHVVIADSLLSAVAALTSHERPDYPPMLLFRRRLWRVVDQSAGIGFHDARCST